MMMRKLTLSLAIVTLTLFAAGASAEDQHAAGDPAASTAKGPADSATPRPEAPVLLRDKELNFLTSTFPLNATYVKKRYGATLPAAVDKAMAKDEEPIAKVIAEFFGTVDRPGLEKIAKTVEAEKANETTKDPRDERYLTLVTRLLWASKLLNGEPSKLPEAQEFNKKFAGEKLDFKSGEFKKVQDKNEEVLSKMRDALNGNTDAKKFLRDNLNRDALLSFADGQRKGGNDKLAKDIVDAVSWNTNGQKFIDVVGPNNQTGRLYLGSKPEEIGPALKAFSEKLGFQGFSLSPTQVEAPAKEWFAGADGKLAIGRPNGVTAPQGPVAKPDAQKGPNSSTTTTTPPPPADGSASAAQVTSFLTSTGQCNKCHAGTGTGSSLKDFKFAKGGKNFSLKEVLSAIDGNATMKNQVSQAAKDQIKKWADLQ